MANDDHTDTQHARATALTDAVALEKAESRRLMISGAAIGALDLVAIAALGVGCPLCAVGAPALIGWGAYRAWKVHALERALAVSRRDAPGGRG